MAVLLSPVGGVAAQFFTNNGVPLSGGKIYTYSAGTSTPLATYTTASGNIQHSNPIVLDAAGRVPTGEIWLIDGSSYKFVLKDSNDVLVGTYDNIIGINSNFVNYTNKQEIQTAAAGQTVFTLATMQYQPGTGNLSVFVDGVNQYGPGAQYAFTETDENTVTFVNGLHVGASVKFTSSQLNTSAAPDASQVSYIPPFANSVATNVENKLAQTVSVKDYGAVGDGVTDDTLAIQAAFTASTGGILYFPAGTYKTSSTLTIYEKHGGEDATNQTPFEIQATGAVIDSSVVGTTEALSIVRCKKINITGLKITQTGSVSIAVYGMWKSQWSNLSLGDVYFGVGSSGAFDSQYWNLFDSCEFQTIVIDTGSASGDNHDFNSNTFVSCRFFNGEYSIKKYGSRALEGVEFIGCDLSYQSLGVLYVDESCGGHMAFRGCYFDSLTGFPPDTGGICIEFDGATYNPNSANVEQFLISQNGSLGETKGFGGVRTGGRLPTSSYNFIKNGDIRAGDAGFSKSSVVVTINSGDGPFGQHATVTGSIDFAKITFESIALPYDGNYTLSVIARQTSGSPAATLSNALYSTNDFGSDWTVNSFTCYYSQGDVATLQIINPASGGAFSWDIAYVGLNYGSQSLLMCPIHPDADYFSPPAIEGGFNTLLIGKSTYSDSIVGSQINSTGKIGCTQSGSTSADDTWVTYSTGAGAYRFYVTMNGVVHATNTTISAISDQRLKENIRELDDGLATVMALKPRKFDWKSGKGKDVKNDRGFIAQEFEQVLPDLIDTWKDPAPDGETPYKSVRQDLIPILVKAIQELKTEIDALKAK